MSVRTFRLALEGLKVVPATLGDQAGILGAAYYALWPDRVPSATDAGDS